MLAQVTFSMVHLGEKGMTEETASVAKFMFEVPDFWARSRVM